MGYRSRVLALQQQQRSLLASLALPQPHAAARLLVQKDFALQALAEQRAEAASMATAVDAAAMQGVLRQHAISMVEQRARYEHSNRELAAELARQQVAAPQLHQMEQLNAQLVDALRRVLDREASAAQSELQAYSENVEGLVSATQDRKLRPDLTQFPKEAAELHALLDHSLGEADGAAVKIAKIGNGIGDAVREIGRAHV